jgi:hypothetical protein
VDVKVSNTALVIEAAAACRSRLRRRTTDFLGSMVLCLFIIVGWPQAVLAEEFKPEPSETEKSHYSPEERKNPHYSSDQKQITPLQQYLIDLNRQNRTARDAFNNGKIPESRIELSKKLVELPSSEITRKRVWWEPSPEQAKKTKEIFDHLCKLNNTLADKNIPHSTAFIELCRDEQLSELKSLCEYFPLDRRCVGLAPSLSDDIPVK